MKTLILIASLFVVSPAFANDTDTLVYNTRRAVTLQGGSNFRDLGGYPAKTGKTVKWGRIYRSADIGKLTDADLQTLTDRHIATVCDLRGPDEIQASPDRLPAGTKWINLPAGSENIRATSAAVMGAKPTNRDSMMLAFYGRTDHLKAKYKPMFDQLLALDDSQSLLFHCTAGKDRTGVGAALILSALGVDKSIILQDYAATNTYWKGNREQVIQQLRQQGIDERGAKAMLTANPAYLENTFRVIDQQYGSMDAFLTQAMELTPDKLTKLRAKYLH